MEVYLKYVIDYWWFLKLYHWILDEYQSNDIDENGEKEYSKADTKLNDEYVREKRFYPVPVNVGCIKGAQCCYDPHCRAFCSLCYGKKILCTLMLNICNEKWN